MPTNSEHQPHGPRVGSLVLAKHDRPHLNLSEEAGPAARHGAGQIESSSTLVMGSPSDFPLKLFQENNLEKAEAPTRPSPLPTHPHAGPGAKVCSVRSGQGSKPEDY